MADITKEPIVAAIGDQLNCPGCGERLTLDWANGWRNNRGYTCRPETTTHSDHIETLEVPS
jgi:hypothetical protein